MEKLSFSQLAVAFVIALLPKFTASLMCFLHDRKIAKKRSEDAISAARR